MHLGLSECGFHNINRGVLIIISGVLYEAEGSLAISYFMRNKVHVPCAISENRTSARTLLFGPYISLKSTIILLTAKWQLANDN